MRAERLRDGPGFLRDGPWHLRSGPWFLRDWPWRVSPWRLFLLVWAALLSGCAYRNAPFTPYAPALYEVVPAETAASGGGRAYLFGAIHTGLSRFYPLPDAVERTWARATHLACELDAQARHAELRAAFSRRTHLPDGMTLDTLVAPEVLHGIRTHLGYGPHEWRQRLRLQPWALAMLMTSADDQRLGTETAQSVDNLFLARARAAGRPILELERVDEQVHAFSGGSLEEQAEWLTQRYRRLLRWERTLYDVVEAWRTGDDGALAVVKERAFGPVSADPAANALRARMFAERDARMAERLVETIRGGGTVFALVGAFHLVGEDRLQKHLEARGMIVRRVAY